MQLNISFFAEKIIIKSSHTYTLLGSYLHLPKEDTCLIFPMSALHLVHFLSTEAMPLCS
jgi:hypothetical protein